MEGISRRDVMGLAAGAIAGGVLLHEAAATAEDSADDVSSSKHVDSTKQNAESPYKFCMSTAPQRRYGESSIREHKLHDFPMSSSISSSLITLAPNDIREPHWHPNSDEWLFVMAGKIRMTIVDGKGDSSQFECGEEDVAFTPQGFGHYVENVGDSPAKLMLIHNHAEFTTVNLSEWLAAGSLSVFASTLKMPLQAFENVPTKKVFIVGSKSGKH